MKPFWPIEVWTPWPLKVPCGIWHQDVSCRSFKCCKLWGGAYFSITVAWLDSERSCCSSRRRVVLGLHYSNINMNIRTKRFLAKHGLCWHPGTISCPGKWCALTWPFTWCIRSGHLFPLLHGPVLMLSIVGTFIGIRVSIGTLTSLRLCSPIHSKLQCTVCSNTFLSQPTQTFTTVTLALLWYWPGGLAFVFYVDHWAWGPCHWLTGFGLLVGIHHCIPGTPIKTCSYGDDPTYLFSQHNLVLVKVTQILILVHFSCFQTSTSIADCSLAA